MNSLDIEKSMSIYRLPKVLVVHLKRFYHSFTSREKISTSIKIPEEALKVALDVKTNTFQNINFCHFITWDHMIKCFFRK